MRGRSDELARQLEDALDGNEAYAKARAEDDSGAVRALEEAAKLSIAHPVETGADWSFVADCDNWWDDGGAPPRYDVMATLTYEDERLQWEGRFHPGYAWIQPYPTYAKILGPWPELSKITENGKEYFDVERARGPNVLDLHARLAAVGIALLPEERCGGQTVIKVVVKDGTTSVSITMRPDDRADTSSLSFSW